MREMIVETLKRSKIFSVLKEDELNEIALLFETLDFKNDEYIFHEGDESKWLYIVSQSRVKMTKHALSGKDMIVEVKAPGGIFCCAAVLDKKPYPESAQAMDQVSVIRINRKNLKKLIEAYPVLNLQIAQYASEKLRDAYTMMKNIATEKVEKRIAAVLLKLAEKSVPEKNGFVKIDFSVTRQEIADMVGSTVETCIRTIREFQKQGLINTAGRRILINPEALQQIVSEYDDV